MVIQFCGSTESLWSAIAVVRCTRAFVLTKYPTTGATVRNRPNSCVFVPYGAQLAIAAAKFSRNISSDVNTMNGMKCNEIGFPYLNRK